MLHLSVCVEAQGTGKPATELLSPHPGWNSPRHRGHFKGHNGFLTSPHSPSHRDLQAWGSKDPSQRNHWVINLISEAGSLGWRRGGNGEPSSLLLSIPTLHLTPRPLNSAHLPSFHPQVKGVKNCRFLLVFPRSLNS